MPILLSTYSSDRKMEAVQTWHRIPVDSCDSVG
jgi:hypothetical protein